ncbi:hypothetical protein G6F42_010881 [Rhizopus arrhizus]|nr:hypothetical protein G6F42_010881 [Rhizopus arrhizus]
MRVISQLVVALALTSCMVQISQALPTTDNMVLKRDGLPLVGDLLGGTLGGGSSSSGTNANVMPAGHGKKNKTGKKNKAGKKVHHKKKPNNRNMIKHAKKVKHADGDRSMAL